jgi:hypothetical protein
MNREVHVRFWESPEVKVLRATRPTRPASHYEIAAAIRGEAERHGSFHTTKTLLRHDALFIFGVPSSIDD